MSQRVFVENCLGLLIRLVNSPAPPFKTTPYYISISSSYDSTLPQMLKTFYDSKI